MNGQLVVSATDYYPLYEQIVSCAKTDYGVNGFIVRIQYGSTEISYTGDGKWVGIEGTPSGDWLSNPEFDDSSWQAIDSRKTEILETSSLSTFDVEQYY